MLVKEVNAGEGVELEIRDTKEVFGDEEISNEAHGTRD